MKSTSRFLLLLGAFVRVCRRLLSDLVLDKGVTADCGKRDRYGRGICRLLLDATDVNLEIVRSGLAWHFKQYLWALTRN